MKNDWKEILRSKSVSLGRRPFGEGQSNGGRSAMADRGRTPEGPGRSGRGNFTIAAFS
jgi:hypothetical protein